MVSPKKMPKAETLDRLGPGASPGALSRREARTGTFGVVDTSAGGAAQMATGNLTYIYIYAIKNGHRNSGFSQL